MRRRPARQEPGGALDVSLDDDVEVDRQLAAAKAVADRTADEPRTPVRENVRCQLERAAVRRRALRHRDGSDGAHGD